MTCLYIIGLTVGAICVQNAEPIGICHPVSDGVVYCTVNMQELPIRASWYDPYLQTDNEEIAALQCQEPCHLLGDGTPVATSYGWAMACPAGMYGLTLNIEHAGQWQCRDHGGAVVPKYGRVFDGAQFVEAWYLTGDFLLQEPAAWSYMLLDWSVVE